MVPQKTGFQPHGRFLSVVGSFVHFWSCVRKKKIVQVPEIGLNDLKFLHIVDAFISEFAINFRGFRASKSNFEILGFVRSRCCSMKPSAFRLECRQFNAIQTKHFTIFD